MVILLKLLILLLLLLQYEAGKTDNNSQARILLRSIKKANFALSYSEPVVNA